ncbi:MAG TPA: formate dehydrogenase accessory protein FdhE [Blastocatellia bacterium]|nr:formate dehydrogenase accessory protein FdhE [Blastocatellia bacterium]
MKDFWEICIARAGELAAKRQETRELLIFYANLLRSQKEIYDYLRSRRDWVPTGMLEQDLTVLQKMMPNMLAVVESCGPAALAEEARRLRNAGPAAFSDMLIEYWNAPSDTEFFAKSFLQPYLMRLAETATRPANRGQAGGENRCPFCDGKPQLSILQIKEASAESGGRDMLCSMCMTAWPFVRVVCASCGENDPALLAYYHSPDYDHVRIDACETCKHYIKSIDLTRLGFAVPLVDEVAAAPLDLWARERGYSKIELNLIGL